VTWDGTNSSKKLEQLVALLFKSNSWLIFLLLVRCHGLYNSGWVAFEAMVAQRFECGDVC
jgi:hypothetical protein